MTALVGVGARKPPRMEYYEEWCGMNYYNNTPPMKTSPPKPVAGRLSRNTGI
jgi:hypothetical protein